VPARLLFVGDIHLGRRPSRLPDDLGEFGIEPSEVTPAAAWRASVRLAVESRVDAVVLAGDVVESLDDRFEAYGHLADGVKDLVAAGIPVFGVAGNHDVLALPRLAEQMPEFRLLGARGKWETAEVAIREGASRLQLLGWSFPSQQVRENPLAALRSTPEAGIATLGVLHCDLDGGSSSYAPVPRTAFESAPGDAWLLGHIHRPSELGGPRPVGYLGSLTALDPGEPGPHGPWLVHVAGPGAVRAEHVPLAPLRYEQEDVPIDAIEDGDHADVADASFEALRAATRRIHDRIGGGSRQPRVVACRLRLVGRSRAHRRVTAALADATSLPRDTHDRTHYFVEKVLDHGAPAIELERLAKGNDPPALLAGRLLALEQGGEAAERLIHTAREHLGSELSGTRWRPPEGLLEPPEAVREILLRAGFEALEALLAQGTQEPEGGA
jgi:predicted phosphodiesterase